MVYGHSLKEVFLMSTKPTGPALDKDALKRQPMVDRRVVDAYERLERKLLKLGVVVKPSYSLEPPLGTNETRARNRYGRN